MVKYALIIILIFATLFFFLSREKEERFFDTKVDISLSDQGQVVSMSNSQAQTVREFLQEKEVAINENDYVFPSLDTKLSSGMTLYISREREFRLEVDQKNERFVTHETTVADAIKEKNIQLDEDDIITPSLPTSLSDDLQIQITRVIVTEETEEKNIPFKTETTEDDNLSWRKTEVAQKGEPGILQTVTRVARHDGEEVSRKLLEKKVIKEPVIEKIRKGTLVKTGKSHRGGASWYAHTGTLSAANPWLPFGSYVKVTNTANGKSVIVKINDRGPFGGGRIIDLDKVAFQEIAPLGQGVADVKMEEITN
jgi:uncharacterized protein YabE (DUF348 family)